MRQAKLDPIHAAALVSTGSLVIYVPIYLALRGFHVAAVPLADLTTQVVFQGIVVTIISLVFYGRAVVILGASGGSAFGALVPALSAVLAIPLLGEWPTASGWVGIVLISAGVYLASGGPLPVMRRHATMPPPDLLNRPPESETRPDPAVGETHSASGQEGIAARSRSEIATSSIRFRRSR